MWCVCQCTYVSNGIFNIVVAIIAIAIILFSSLPPHSSAYVEIWGGRMDCRLQAGSAIFDYPHAKK